MSNRFDNRDFDDFEDFFRFDERNFNEEESERDRLCRFDRERERECDECGRESNRDRECERECRRECEREEEREEERENERRRQRHVHEFQGSTKFACDECVIHNHRFAGVSGPAIPRGNSHVHRIETRTDTFVDHNHEICVITGPAIPVGRGKHVHFVTGRTSCNDGHRHEFQFATLIESPADCERDRRRL